MTPCTSYARRAESGSTPDRSRSTTESGEIFPCSDSSATSVRAYPRAASSSSATRCTTPDRRLCGSGPPSRAMSTSSPVTDRTTSGPVTKIRPWRDRITTSVRAGPYAAPPAAGPSTTEICGTTPDAAVIAANTVPTPCSDATPSASRAPPECHRPMTGTPRAMASL